ncbi:hypothetical protein FVR03_04735 [Pontibacter qinzhouensis]|uniref:Uncharacterized protein n=1 Tax=Pontibacter qinzhouensis TaxID=2603253 RepID=A0A5C8KBD0_9BACT|nr:hypothetical protein [Pontibacter qinzhouensis]TXK50492.1 hypothetical protein FVR03_04735 [Pontibacter qinzhouensis]
MSTTDKTAEVQQFRTALEELVRQKVYVRVQYHSEIGEFMNVRALLKQLTTTAGVDYLELATGETIPLSKLVRVGDTPAPGYDTEYFKCDI